MLTSLINHIVMLYLNCSFKIYKQLLHLNTIDMLFLRDFPSMNIYSTIVLSSESGLGFSARCVRLLLYYVCQNRIHHVQERTSSIIIAIQLISFFANFNLHTNIPKEFATCDWSVTRQQSLKSHRDLKLNKYLYVAVLVCLK